MIRRAFTECAQPTRSARLPARRYASFRIGLACAQSLQPSHIPGGIPMIRKFLLVASVAGFLLAASTQARAALQQSQSSQEAPKVHSVTGKVTRVETGEGIFDGCKSGQRQESDAVCRGQEHNRARPCRRRVHGDCRLSTGCKRPDGRHVGYRAAIRTAVTAAIFTTAAIETATVKYTRARFLGGIGQRMIFVTDNSYPVSLIAPKLSCNT